MIRARIERFLSEAQRASEFAHTVLHNNPAKNQKHPAYVGAAAPAALPLKNADEAWREAERMLERQRIQDEARREADKAAREALERRAREDEARRVCTCRPACSRRAVALKAKARGGEGFEMVRDAGDFALPSSQAREEEAARMRADMIRRQV